MKTIVYKADTIHVKDLPKNPIVGAFLTDNPSIKSFLVKGEPTGELSYRLMHSRGFYRGRHHRDFRGTLHAVLRNPDLTYLLFDSEKELFAWLAAEPQPTTGTSKEAAPPVEEEEEEADTFAESLMKSFIAAAHETPADHCPLTEAIKEAGISGVEQETVDAIKAITGIKPDSKVKIVQIGKHLPDEGMDMYDLLRRLIVG